MKLAEHPEQHLAYCLNVHPGNTWSENFAAIRTAATQVQRQTSVGAPFGLGMRLGRAAADELSQPAALQEFRRFLAMQDMYVFTINGFPYGEFHAAGVKTSVYRPDWRDRERLDYTCTLCSILARLLPPGVAGSISTVPGSFRAWIRTEEDRRRMAGQLAAAALHAEQESLRFGRDVHIGLEPEPDCTLETTGDALRFFKEDLQAHGGAYLKGAGLDAQTAGTVLARRLGICFDTCHLAVQFEDIGDSMRRLREAGIRISKVQISSALQTLDTPGNRQRLRPFCDPVYLHQVKARNAAGNVASLGDLEDALESAEVRGREWRIHCHVPLYYAGGHGLESTSGLLTPSFFQEAAAGGCTHFEIETYTFGVLPAALQEEGTVGSIAREYQWVRPLLAQSRCPR